MLSNTLVDVGSKEKSNIRFMGTVFLKESKDTVNSTV